MTAAASTGSPRTSPHSVYVLFDVMRSTGGPATDAESVGFPSVPEPEGQGAEGRTCNSPEAHDDRAKRVAPRSSSHIPDRLSTERPSEGRRALGESPAVITV